jgi:hypothetical protein
MRLLYHKIDHYRHSEFDRTYEMPKSYVDYRKPRQMTDEQREKARERIKRLNGIQ